MEKQEKVNSNKIYNIIKIIIIVSIIAVLITLLINQFKAPKVICNHKKQIDSLQLVIDSLNNDIINLQNKTDSVKTEIIEIDKKYETIFMDVTNQSVDSDIVFFRNYISKND